jgi:hypothetical protein
LRHLSPLLRCVAWLAALCFAATAWAQQGQRRVALVIGNNSYPSAPLLNPVNDAKAMAAALGNTGFAVILRTNASQSDIQAALREFGNRLKDGGPGAAGLFYFAGHGMQIKGRNFLVPVGANIEHEDEVAYQSVDAQAVLDKMESAGNGTNLVILDACRNNPFARSFRSSQQGLAAMEAPVGTLVAFATAPGAVASDGLDGGNGLYTQHLLNAIKQPGLRVEDVFKQVRAAVRRDSKGRQVPMEWSALEGDFYFLPAKAEIVLAPAPAPLLLPTQAAAAPDPLQALDDALWGAVKDSSSSAELYAYLNRFPNGRHAKAAREKLLAMSAPAALTRPAEAAPDTPASIEPDSPRNNDAVLEESTRRLADIVKWGDENTDRRPAQPKLNSRGFAEGDRYRYQVLDRMRNEYVQWYLWRVDRVETDGSLVVNDGAVKLDGQGDPLLVNDTRSGAWQQWSPPLPIADAVTRGVGHKREISGQLEMRSTTGIVSEVDFNGSLRVAASEGRNTKAGYYDTLRVEVDVSGRAKRSDGTRPLVNWRMTYWFAPAIGLPLEVEIDERVDGQLERRLTHEITALDVWSTRSASR